MSDMGANSQHVVSIADVNESTGTVQDEASVNHRLLTNATAAAAAAVAVAADRMDANTSRKRSLENNGASSKRNSKNRASASARVRCVDDFDSLFEQVGAGSCAEGFEFAEIASTESTAGVVVTSRPLFHTSGGIRQRDSAADTAVVNGGDDDDCDSDSDDAILCARQRQRRDISSSPPPPSSSSSSKECRFENTRTNRDQANSNDDELNVKPASAFTNGLSRSSVDETIDKQSRSCPPNEESTLLLSASQEQTSTVQLVPYTSPSGSGSGSESAPATAVATLHHRLNVVENLSSSARVERCNLIEECRYNVPDNVIRDVVRESKYTSTTEKKTSRKKKIVAQCQTNAAENVSTNTTTSTTINTKCSSSAKAAATVPSANDGVVPKPKKSKKNKKYGDEKENISVIKPSLQIQHGDDTDDLNFHQMIDDGDEFSNVCVRELRSGFGKFDQLTKKALLHVRSQDSSKAQQHFSQSVNGAVGENACSTCKACNKNVFAMEMIKAERAVWHRNCFRCDTCSKQLTVDIYSSHEGRLYCKPHFKDLFKPKVVVEDETPVKLKKPELIIRENQPLELPPDVVRACDKPDLGLDELSSLNVKSRFQVFERANAEEDESVVDRSAVCVKRSPSILSKLARFQAKGMDVGVSSDILNGIDYAESTSSEEEENEAQKEDKQSNNIESNGITKSVVSREKPIAFNKMNDVKKNWENGQTARNEERREERREELQRIRSRLFMGKQNKMKEAYENAVAESEKCCVKRDVEIKAENARLIKEKFEKGQVIHYEDSDEEVSAKKPTAKEEDMDVFEAGISKKSRSIFQEMDAAVKTHSKNVSPQIPTPTSTSGSTIRNGQRERMMDRQLSSENVVRSSDPVDQVVVKTADISSKFKFFETYKPPETKRKAFRITPPREGQLLQSNSPDRDVNVADDCDSATRCLLQVEDESQLLKKSNTTAKMLSLFRQLEEAQQVLPDGPKPMKKFTPPPMSSEESSDNGEEDDDDESTADEDDESLQRQPRNGDDIIRACDRTEDEYLKLAQASVKAKSLKEKFEKWQPEKQSNNNAVNLLDSEQASLDTTKSLRARFESFRSERPLDKPRPKVNRFVPTDKCANSLPGCCDTCFKTVYQLEKVEAGDKIFHRSCFRCSRCNGVLRMETFTMNNGQLYCVPHFKQLFIVKGNYDEGFGNDQHKNKWTMKPDVVPTTVSNT